MSDEKSIKITKENHIIVFDILILTPEGAIYTDNFKQSGELAAINTQSNVEMNVQNIHSS